MTTVYERLAYALKNGGISGAIDPILEQVLKTLSDPIDNLEGRLQRKDNPHFDGGHGSGVEGVVSGTEDVTVTVKNPKAGQMSARGTIEPQHIFALAPQRTETPVKLDYERFYLAQHPELIPKFDSLRFLSSFFVTFHIY